MSESLDVMPSRLAGATRVPGDKSVTHRAILIAAVSDGVSEIVNPGTGADNLSTLSAVRALGVEATFDDPRHFTVVGRGRDGLRSPAEPIDCGNSGTTARLLCGLLAGASVEADLIGDASLSRRPMARVAAPLRELGYDVTTGEGGKLPLRIRTADVGDAEARSDLKVASAQVKSCILLAGLFRATATVVTEPEVSRDHTERLLRAVGLRCSSSPHYLDPAKASELGGRPTVRLHGGAGSPLGRTLEVPGDPSSAAFLVVAGLLAGDGVTIEDVGTNPTRARFLDVIARMGATVEMARRRALTTGEPTADLVVSRPTSLLASTELAGFEIPLIIDEVPILCVLGAASRGRFTVRDAAELRVKESDRVERTADLLRTLGVEVETTADGLEFDGLGEARWPGFDFDCGDDHRIAMAAIVAALAATSASRLSATECVAVSYPDFVDTLGRLGGRFTK